MKIRIKYSKTGPLKFIGHLDVMRYFQKAINRADLDVAYSQGFSPHQLISFAAPLSLGVTSDGEYFDAEMNSVTSSKDMIDRLNAVSVPFIQVSEITLLNDNEKSAMASVKASDYLILFNENAELENMDQYLESFYASPSIMAMKKTKKSESFVDIKPLIFDLHMVDDKIYMLLSTGSTDNLKPSLVMKAFCEYVGLEHDPYGYQIHRLETYMHNENHRLMPLYKAGKEIV